MEQDLAKFRAAHQAWETARRKFDREIKDVLDGDGLARARLPGSLRQHDLAYRDMLKAGEPFFIAPKDRPSK
jgi:hypothetical protein